MSIITYADLEAKDATAGLSDEEIAELESETRDFDAEFEAEYEARIFMA